MNSQEYETLSKKITELISVVEEQKVLIRKLETDISLLRGQFNRKLAGLKKEDQETPEEETKNINNPVLLPYNGFFK